MENVDDIERTGSEAWEEWPKTITTCWAADKDLRPNVKTLIEVVSKMMQKYASRLPAMREVGLLLEAAELS
jgi:hypothetical protein